MGIFISADPAMDGLNWYAYCGNNPMNYVDPWGLGTDSPGGSSSGDNSQGSDNRGNNDAGLKAGLWVSVLFPNPPPGNDGPGYMTGPGSNYTTYVYSVDRYSSDSLGGGGSTGRSSPLIQGGQKNAINVIQSENDDDFLNWLLENIPVVNIIKNLYDFFESSSKVAVLETQKFYLESRGYYRYNTSDNLQIKAAYVETFKESLELGKSSAELAAVLCAMAASSKPSNPKIGAVGKWKFGAFKSPAKWQNQMTKRGWTPQQITEAIQNGKQFNAINMINPANKAIRYVHPETMKSVVIDTVTNEVLHIGGEGFVY